MNDFKALIDNAPNISRENIKVYPEHYDGLCRLAEACKTDERITGVWYIEGKTVDDNDLPCLIIRSTVPDAEKERGQVEKVLFDCCDCEILFDYDDVVSLHSRGEKFILNYGDYLHKTLRPDSVFTVYNRR